MRCCSCCTARSAVIFTPPSFSDMTLGAMPPAVQQIRRHRSVPSVTVERTRHLRPDYLHCLCADLLDLLLFSLCARYLTQVASLLAPAACPEQRLLRLAAEIDSDVLAKVCGLTTRSLKWNSHSSRHCSIHSLTEQESRSMCSAHAVTAQRYPPLP